MKTIVSKLTILILALLCCKVAGAQESSSAWITFAPEGEEFNVSMPRRPFPVEEKSQSGALGVAGRRYSFSSGDAVYTVWSFKAANLPAELRSNPWSYLDACAELAWDLMVKPHWDLLTQHAPSEELMKYGMTFNGLLPAEPYNGRRYLLRLGEHNGATRIYAGDERIYIVAARGAERDASSVVRFMDSFKFPGFVVSAPAGGPVGDAAPPVPAGVGPGRGNHNEGGKAEGGGGTEATLPVDYDKPFPAREVTKKASIRSKPEPSYTESARKFGVIGTVRMRLILTSSGKVSGITVLTKLPHGLTQKAIEAARKIGFEPALKDGRPVSQYVTFEYNFNIY